MNPLGPLCAVVIGSGLLWAVIGLAYRGLVVLLGRGC